MMAMVEALSLTAESPEPAKKESRIVYQMGGYPAAIVMALYVFVGNSGVLSFGHVSFVAVGAFAAGLVSVPKDLKLDG